MMQQTSNFYKISCAMEAGHEINAGPLAQGQ